jgi:hypothetical protein
LLPIAKEKSRRVTLKLGGDPVQRHDEVLHFEEQARELG